MHLRSLGPLEGPWWCPRSGRGRTDPAAPGAWRSTQGGSESGGRLSAALFRQRHRAELLESPGMHGHWVEKNMVIPRETKDGGEGEKKALVIQHGEAMVHRNIDDF